METKHTQGPWNVSYNTTAHLPFAYVISNKQESDEEAEANAKLIAAAPELLEALEIVRIACEVEKVNAEYGQHPDHWTNKVLNAIKKATL